MSKKVNTPDPDREAFEKWASERSWPLVRINEGVQGAAHYEDMFVSCAWLSWQAALAYAYYWDSELTNDIPEIIQ